MTDLNEIIENIITQRLKGIRGQESEVDEVIMTAQEALKFFNGGVTYGTLMRECRNGNVPHFRVGSRVYFRKSKLMEWIKAQERGGNNGGDN